MKPKRRSCAKKCRGKGIGQARNKFMKAMNTTKGKFQEVGRKLKGKGFMKKLKKVGSAVVKGAKQVGQFAKDTKILSRGAMLMGRPDLAMAAEHFGAGIGQTRNRMMAAANATKGAFKTFGRKLKGGRAVNWDKRCATNKKQRAGVVKRYNKSNAIQTQCKTREKAGYVKPKMTKYQEFVKHFMLDNAGLTTPKKDMMRVAAAWWGTLSDSEKKDDHSKQDSSITQAVMENEVKEANQKYGKK